MYVYIVTLSTWYLLGWTYAKTCGLYHGWKPSFCSKEKHGMLERAHAGIQQASRGETILQVCPLKCTFWPWRCFFYIQYVSCFFHTRHYVGVNIWTSKRLQSMPLALRTLSAQKKKLMDLWNWPGRNLPNCWRSGKHWVTFLMIIWWIVKSCTCHRRQLLYTITLTT